jgi:urease accessory protein
MFDGQSSSWHATLALQVRTERGRSVVSHRHHGPLRLQKALYPEGGAVAHAVLIHPPGGIAGGDGLEISVNVDREAHALLTTPGAAKWYKANGRCASQQVRLGVEGVLEWLPQETIVFDAAVVRSAIDIQLGPRATSIGWDIVALGRRAAGERFESGVFTQSIRLRSEHALLWSERTRVAGSDRLLSSPVGLDGHTVFGCFWAAGAAVESIDLDSLRAQVGVAAAAAPITRLAPQLLVARTLAAGTAIARAALTAWWVALRPLLCGRAAQPPRVWAT